MDRLGLGKDTEVNKLSTVPSIRLSISLDPGGQHVELSYTQLVKDYFRVNPEIAALYKKEKPDKPENLENPEISKPENQSESKENTPAKDEDPLGTYSIKNRFTDVISRIERRYAIQAGSEEEEAEDSDDYDKNDKFIDDSEIFKGQNLETKHGWFFVNSGEIETVNDESAADEDKRESKKTKKEKLNKDPPKPCDNPDLEREVKKLEEMSKPYSGDHKFPDVLEDQLLKVASIAKSIHPQGYITKSLIDRLETFLPVGACTIRKRMKIAGGDQIKPPLSPSAHQIMRNAIDDLKKLVNENLPHQIEQQKKKETDTPSSSSSTTPSVSPDKPEGSEKNDQIEKYKYKWSEPEKELVYRIIFECLPAFIKEKK